MLITGIAEAGDPPQVAIIIDDLGDRLVEGQRSVDLPGEVTLSFLPMTPYAHALSREALKAGKEIMLHLPLESVVGKELGPGGLTAAMDHAEFVRRLREDIASMPEIQGINNHMGSMLTPRPRQMGWLMDEIKENGKLFFVDSLTTPLSIAYRLAEARKIPAYERDIFLDNRRDRRAIGRQLQSALLQAKGRGFALAIGHPYPETLTVLEERLPQLRRQGIELVSASKLIAYAEKRRSSRWHESLSPLPLVAKSSRP